MKKKIFAIILSVGMLITSVAPGTLATGIDMDTSGASFYVEDSVSVEEAEAEADPSEALAEEQEAAELSQDELQDEQQEPVTTDDETLDSEEEAVSVNQVLSDGNVQVAGVILENSAVVAGAASVSAAATLDDLGEDVVDAYSIHLVNEGEEIQPDSRVTVTIRNVSLENSEQVSVLHVLDSAEDILAKAGAANVSVMTDGRYASLYPEAVSAAAAATGAGSTIYVEEITPYVSGSTISFAVDSFSIFLIKDPATTEDPDPDLETVRHIYHFLDELNDDGTADPFEFYSKSGHLINQQVLKNDESLTHIGDPYKLGETFLGWYYVEKQADGTYAYTDEEVDFDSPVSVTEEEDVEYYIAPKFEKVYYITFHQYPKDTTDQNDVLLTKKVVYTSGSDANQVLISDVQASQTDSSTIFYGWTDGEHDYDIYGGTTSVQETKIEGVTSDLDLYPLFVEAHWLKFNTDSQNSYISSMFVRDDNTSITKLDVPTKTGYTFVGWALADDTMVTDENGNVLSAAMPNGYIELSEDTTLKAVWEANENTRYSIVIWRQKVSDSKTATESEKTYDYVETISVTGKTGDPATVDPSYTQYTEDDYTGFKYARTGPEDATISADGSTVVNVYYDRMLMTYNFYYQNQVAGSTTAYTYTQTTGNNGTQYGITADGSYVQLERESENTSRTYYTYGNGGNRREYTGTFYTREWSWDDWDYIYTASQYSGSNLPPANDRTYYARRNNGSYSELTRRTETVTTYVWKLNGEVYTGSRYTRSTVSGTPYMVTWTGLYGQTFEQNEYTWPSNRRWNDGNRTQTFLASFVILTNPYNLYDRGSVSTTNPIYHYTQGLDGKYHNDATGSFTAYGTVGTFYFQDKFTGFTVASYDSGKAFSENGGSNPISPGNSTSSTNDLRIYHTRNKWSIGYISDGEPVHTEENIYYQNPLESYDYSLTQVGLPEKEHYTFAGWYADEAFSTKFDFNGTMPNANVAVYAKWEPDTYTVTYEPEYGEFPEGVTSNKAQFTYGSEDRPANYDMTRDYIVDDNGDYIYDEETHSYIDAPSDTTAQRYRKIDEEQDATYRFIGWYVVDENGEITDTPFDYTEQVTKDITVRAKWILTGEYQLIYNGVMETETENVSGTPYKTSETFYANSANIIIDPAPTDITARWVFDGWEVVDADGKTLSNNDGKYYQPGDQITLDVARWARNKIVRMRAHYSRVDGSDKTTDVTSVIFDANGGSVADSIKTETKTGTHGNKIDITVNDEKTTVTWDHLLVNEAIGTYGKDAFTRDHYELIGWNTKADGSGDTYKLGATIGADNEDEMPNKLYAMWQEEEVELTYKVIGPDGTVDEEGKIATLTKDTESVKAQTGTAEGSTPTAESDKYVFEGWYTDEACTIPVDEAWVDQDNHITPEKSDDGYYEEATYYAKFTYQEKTLTLTKTGMEEGESAIFNVTGNFVDENGKLTEKTIRVAIPNGQSVTIANVVVGETYTIVEEGSWSWRYTAETVSHTVTDDEDNQVTITNTLQNDKYLDGSANAVNKGTVTGNKD